MWDSSQGAADPSCMEEGLKVVPFPRKEEHPAHWGSACSQDKIQTQQFSLLLASTPGHPSGCSLGLSFSKPSLSPLAVP